MGLRSRLALICLVGVAVIFVAAGTAFAAGVWSAPRQLDDAGAGVADTYLAECVSDSLCFGANTGIGTYGGPVAYHLASSGAANSAFAFGLTIPFGSGDNGVGLSALQCPSASLCVGLADYGNDEEDVLDVVVSTTPAAGPTSWVEQKLQDAPDQLSCPSTTLCAGPDQDGAILTSQDPGGGAAAWMSTKLATAIDEVECSSADFCLAVDTDGDVWTSIDPGGGSGAWIKSGSPAPLKALATATAGSGGGDDGSVPENLSGAGPTLCVATGTAGAVLVSIDPTSAAGWTSVKATTGTVTAVDCEPGTSLCLAGDKDGNIADTTDGVGATWTSVATTAGSPIQDLSCAAATCMAAPRGEYPAAGGTPLLATIPAGPGAWQWNGLKVVTHDALSSISCPSLRECIGADPARYYASANPAKGVSSWHTTLVKNVPGDSGIETFDTSCYSATGCLAVTYEAANGFADVAGGELDRFNPAGGAHAFHNTGVGGEDGILFAACAQGTCVVGYPGRWYQTARPALNTGWKHVASPHFDVTCLRGNRSCVALPAGPFPGAAGPDLLVAAQRTGPWKTEVIDPRGQITGLACTAARACVVVDQAGRLLASTAPTDGVATWHLRDTDPDGFNGVACEKVRTCVAVDDDGGVVVGRP